MANGPGPLAAVERTGSIFSYPEGKLKFAISLNFSLHFLFKNLINRGSLLFTIYDITIINFIMAGLPSYVIFRQGYAWVASRGTKKWRIRQESEFEVKGAKMVSGKRGYPPPFRLSYVKMSCYHFCCKVLELLRIFWFLTLIFTHWGICQKRDFWKKHLYYI